MEFDKNGRLGGVWRLYDVRVKLVIIFERKQKSSRVVYIEWARPS